MLHALLDRLRPARRTRAAVIPSPAVARPATAARAAAPPAPLSAAPAAMPPTHGAAPTLATDASAHATLACMAVAELRTEFGRGPEAEDVRAVLAALERDPMDAVRQLPGAAREALALCSDARASAADLAGLCERDPGVAPALLRYANSSHYARGGERVTGLREAVHRVGFAGVRNVLLDVTVHGLLCQPGPELTVLAQEVWTHMIATAPLARAVAPAFGAPPETAYALGLLHDVGKLVLLDQISALRARRRAAPRLPAPFVTAALRALHEPLGAIALRRWGLGDDAARAVGAHHRAPPPAVHDPLGETLFLAERAELARRRGTALDLDALWASGALRGDQVRATALLAAHPVPA
jgi:HD-like signal output (HDOD) protein